MVSSYCSAVTPGAAVKRARRLVVRASMTGAADGLVVAIDGLLRVDAPDRADLQPSTSYRVAWRARILSQKALRNLSAFSTARAFSSPSEGLKYLQIGHFCCLNLIAKSTSLIRRGSGVALGSGSAKTPAGGRTTHLERLERRTWD